MTQNPATFEYLVISRGQWDREASPEDIQKAIDQFYLWLDNHIASGKMKTGQRLAREKKLVSRSGGITDGPFTEAKEVIGGYWFIVAGSLEEAAELASGNPCLRFGLSYEIRPIETEKASAHRLGNETPGDR